jgi:hypothetical protein
MHVHPAEVGNQTALSVRNRLGLAAGLLAGAAALSAHATHPIVTVYVDKTAPQGGDGSSWQKAYRDIHDAFGNLGSKVAGITPPPDCTIKVAQGEYKPDQGTGDRSKQFALSFTGLSASSVLLAGSFGGLQSANPDAQNPDSTPTLISGDLSDNDGPDFTNRSDNSRSLLTVRSVDARIRLQGVSFGGASNDSVLLSASPIPSLAAVTLSAQRTTPFTSSSFAISLTDCRFMSNESQHGAGACAAASEQIALENCDFVGNRSMYGMGGALQMNPNNPPFASTRLERCVFRDNSAASGGAVAAFRFCTATRSIFDSNEANQDGGAITIRDGWRISACLFTRNIAGQGGAVHASGIMNTLSLEQCTIASNRAAYGDAAVVGGSELKLDRVIVWDHRSSLFNEPINASNTRWVTAYASVLQGGAESIYFGAQTVAPIVDANPKFIAPASGPSDPRDFAELNYRLRLDSPALKLGYPGYPLFNEFDLDGVRGVWFNSLADAGCYFNTVRTCLPDLNSAGPDFGLVNDADFALFAIAYDALLIPEGANPSADFNRDGVINDEDFQHFVGAYEAGICP